MSSRLVIFGISSKWQVATQLNRSNGAMRKATTMERRGRAAQRRVESCQVSRARHELTGAALAPKTQATFDELQRKRPQEQVRQIPPEVMGYVPEQALMMDFALFTKCLQSAPSGVSAGPGGCTNEMLRVCLDDAEVLQLLFRVAEDFARTNVPESVSKAFMAASMTALQKHDGGVRHRGWLPKRWLVSSAQKGGSLRTDQFALSTRAGTDCVGHAIRAITDADPIGAYDHVLRSAMLTKVCSVPGLRALLPFVRAI